MASKRAQRRRAERKTCSKFCYTDPARAAHDAGYLSMKQAKRLVVYRAPECDPGCYYVGHAPFRGGHPAVKGGGR